MVSDARRQASMEGSQAYPGVPAPTLAPVRLLYAPASFVLAPASHITAPTSHVSAPSASFPATSTMFPAMTSQPPTTPFSATLAPVPLKLDHENFSFWRSLIFPSVRVFDLEDFLLGIRICPPKFVSLQGGEGSSSSTSSLQIGSLNPTMSVLNS